MESNIEHKTTFNPNPLQKKFIESQARADLFSSRMGEGKSTALAWAALYHTRHNPGARWALIRDTYENMQATTQKTFFEWFPPGIYGNYIAGRKTFVWASGVAEGEVEFLGMDAPEDASKLMSRELGGFAIDEPAPAIGSVGVDELIFDLGLSRLRQRGMKWYGAKLAENNPDETHWTYRKFAINANGDDYKLWQPPEPENMQNLPPSYYAQLRQTWAHRPDLVRRFVEGEFGFQAVGKAVTPQWNDRLHLGVGLVPVKGVPLALLWDWGHNPTCIITQKTPMGAWNVLDAVVGEEMGAEELVVSAIRPLLVAKYRKFEWLHIGDPAGKQRDQTSIFRSPVKVVRKALGGSFRAGPVRFEERVEPLRAVLGRNLGGRGLLRVDKHNAPAVWQALRGGWHFHVAKTGLTSTEPVKDLHSHPGDAMGYGAAILFPLGRLARGDMSLVAPREGGYFGTRTPRPPIGPNVAVQVPKHGERLLPLDPGERK